MIVYNESMPSLGKGSDDAKGSGEHGGFLGNSQEECGHPSRHLVVEIPEENREYPEDRLMREMYKKYTTKSGMMDIQGLWRCMQDVGLLDGRPAQESRDAVVAMFASLDVRKRNRINENEFAKMWAKINAPRLGDVISKEDPGLVAALFESFCSWSTFGSPRVSHTIQREYEIMGSSHWNKLCRDVGLVHRGGHADSSQCVSFSDVDIMFAKVKARGMKKINFSQFVDALGLMAEKYGSIDVMDVVHMIVQRKPSLNGTVVSTPIFRPSTTRYNIFKKDLVMSPKTVLDAYATKRGQDSPSVKVQPPSGEEGEMLLHLYGQYARFGHRRKSHAMSDQQFAKLCRECGIEGKNLPLVRIDLIFAKAKRPGKNSLMFDDFLVALSMIASEMGTDEQSLHALICGNTTGPRINNPKS